MTTKSQSQDERIAIHVNSESKSLFLNAADLSGQNLSTFIIESVRQRAVRILEDYDKIRLNNIARDSFLDALLRAAEKHTMK